MSDTPRTDAGLEYDDTTVDDVKDFARQLEHELNEANYRIKRLEEMYEGVIGEQPELLGSNVMGLLKRELNDTQRRIKRLEEAGDRMRLYCADNDDCFAWDRAKEHKP